MLQTNDSSALTGPSTRHASAPGRRADPPRVTELTDADDFRRLAERQALRCRRYGQPMSALSLHLQPDKRVGDALASDWLVECTRRVCGRVRSTDTVVCWPDHHHGVLLLGCPQQHAAAVLRRLTGVLNEPYGLGDRLLYLHWQGAVLDLTPG